LVTPEEKLCMIIPLPPATGKVLFHTETDGAEVDWNAQSCYRLRSGVAVRPLQAKLTGVILLADAFHAQKPQAGGSVTEQQP